VFGVQGGTRCVINSIGIQKSCTGGVGTQKKMGGLATRGEERSVRGLKPHIGYQERKDGVEQKRNGTRLYSGKKGRKKVSTQVEPGALSRGSV